MDILATDTYDALQQPHYDDLLALANGKPVAVGEVAYPGVADCH